MATKTKKPIHEWAKPTFDRKTNSKNSNLQWSETGLDSYQIHKLQEHMGSVIIKLRELFELNRKLLPKKSHLAAGNCHGSWWYCPNHIADEVETLIKAAHADFLAQNYSIMDGIE
jgi:hypothetical protein